jgi:alkaline phosphatase D
MTAPDDLAAALSSRLVLHRRRFLGLMAAGAGALVVGCSDDGSDGGSPTSTAGGKAGGEPGAGGPTVASGPVPSGEGLAGDPFGLGVASGDPTPSAVILWTRLITDLDDTTGTGGLGAAPAGADEWAVRWEVASDEAFGSIVASGDEPAPAEFGHAVHVDATGLEPDTWYWYRFRIGDHTSEPARTRTAPTPDAAVEELRFAFASCQRRSSGYWTAYDAMAADELDLVFHLGDYVYEYPGGEGDLAVNIEAEPQDLAGYRHLYAIYKRDPKLQAAHARCPWVVTWDDHEVENNVAGETAEKPEDQPTFAGRRAAAFQAYWEHQPLRLDPPDDDGLRLFRTFRYGSLADVFVLDGRQYRTDQACGDNLATNRTECADIDDVDRTMLGEEQETWLYDGLTGATATWKVLAQQTVMKALVIGDIVLNVDQWDGYAANRQRLFETIAENEVENVVVLTGDIHVAGAADLRVPAAGLDGEIVAHELVGPGISSTGLIPDGIIDTETLGLAHANLSTNGYVRCQVTPERWVAEFIEVDVSTPTAPAAVDATIEITAGTPGLRTV